MRVDTEQIKRRELERKQLLEQKKKQEIEELRNQARQRELTRHLKLKAAIMIQKWVRGHLCRREHAKMRANFRYIRKLRRMLSIAYGRKKTRFIK
jgi:DNA primase large subunit